ncbi:Clavaminate synthase-like protein [Lentinula aff. detonsa]|nr:Clavaminate synthase-like protein [Lentinula aff. detonsa]
MPIWLSSTLRDFATPEARAQLAVFFYLIGLGYSKEQMERMFDIADVPFSQVGDQEKEKYLASMKQAGSFQGYKLRQFWHIDNGVLDQVETYNIHRDVNRRAHPEALRPLLPEIDQFARHSHMNVLSPILKLMALGLELPEETLLDMHRWDGDSETYRILGLIGTITLLYSQPVSALQILARDGTWKWIKHIENAIVVNSGDAMDFLSGGLYLVQPPPNQLGVIYFCMANDDVKLAPLVASPVLQGLGIKRRFERDEDAPVIAEWRKARTAAYGQSVLSKSTEEGEVEQEVIQGVVVKHNL